MKTTHHLKLNIFTLLYKIWDISEISSVINEELMDINENLNQKTDSSQMKRVVRIICIVMIVRESQKLSGNFQLTNLVNNKTLLFY